MLVFSFPTRSRGILAWLILGLGFLWILWDKQNRSWHDIYSDSRIVQLPKNAHKK